MPILNRLGLGLVLASFAAFLQCATIPSFSSAPLLDGGTPLDATIATDADTPTDAKYPSDGSLTDASADGGNTNFRIFVTKKGHPGSMGAGDSGTVELPKIAARLDAICQDAWYVAHQERKEWRALVWITPSGTPSPFSNLKSPPGGWYRVPKGTLVGGVLVASTAVKLVSGALESAVLNDEAGDPVTEGVWVGGTVGAGTVTCNAWQNKTTGAGEIGKPDVNTDGWFGGFTAPCSEERHIYCVEVAP